jgi:hypothetical protein
MPALQVGLFPRLLGILLVIASIGYLTGSFTSLLSPEKAAIVSQVIIVPAVVAELSLCLWLLIRGVRPPETW